MKMPRFQITFNDGKILKISATKYETKDGLHLFYLDSPNLGKFAPFDIVKQVDPLPEAEYKPYMKMIDND